MTEKLVFVSMVVGIRKDPAKKDDVLKLVASHDDETGGSFHFLTEVKQPSFFMRWPARFLY